MRHRSVRSVASLVVVVVLLLTAGRAEAKEWVFGDNRFFTVDRICRDGAVLWALDISSAGASIDVGARLYTNTGTPLPVPADPASRSAEATYGPVLAATRIFTMTTHSAGLPADTDGNAIIDFGEYYPVFTTGVLLWPRLNAGQVVVITHQGLGFIPATVQACDLNPVAAPYRSTTVLPASGFRSGSSLLPPVATTYRVEVVPASGTFRVGGATLAVGSTFTQDDLNQQRATYVHTRTSLESDSLAFTAFHTSRASLATGGAQGNGDSSSPAISGDGRYVAFMSTATTLVAGDTNTCTGYATSGQCPDIFVRDQLTGQTTRVSVSSAGVQAGGASFSPALSADGRYVAFESQAPNLVAGDTHTCPNYPVTGECPDIFVRDLQTGQTVRVSVTSAGQQSNDESHTPAISSTGRFVVFQSIATNLVASDTNSNWDIFIHDRDTDGNGVFDEAGKVSTSRVSVASNGTQSNGYSYRVTALSADGRFVLFRSDATNLVSGDTNGASDLFLRDRQAGTTVRVSVAANGDQATSSDPNIFPESRSPAISADGRFIAFQSYADNLVANDFNGLPDIFVRDRDTDGNGVFDEPGKVSVELVSRADNGTQANDESDEPALSADGRFVAFYSLASNLVDGDTNTCTGYLNAGQCPDIFVRDLAQGVLRRASLSAAGAQANAGSMSRPALSADGSHIAFQSLASNLASGDTNARADILVRYFRYLQTVPLKVLFNVFLPTIRR